MENDIYYDETNQLSEAEIIFNSTTSKKNLSGVRGRASRTGRKGAVMTPVDYLRGKEKKEYMKNSEVKIYNMYDNKVLPYDEFKELPVDKQVVLMTKWREEIGTNNIIKDMKISRKKFYSEVLNALGIETKPRGRRGRKDPEEQPAVNIAQNRTEQKILITEEREKEGIFLVIKGAYSGDILSNRLAGLSGLFDEHGEFELKLEIREKFKV